MLDLSASPHGRWFTGGEINTCWNALDRHADGGRGAQPALIWDSPVTGQVRVYTYAELRDAVARAAGALRVARRRKGDRVLLYMPMVPEAAIGMLACARLGAIHSVVFGGFAPRELATRIDDARPKVILTASCGVEAHASIAYQPLLDAAIELARGSPSAAWCCSATRRAPSSIPGATSTGRTGSRRRRRATACRSRPPIRSTSSTPRAPPACPRAWSATTAAMRWRWPGA